MRIVNLKSGMPDVDTARRRLIAEIDAARRDGQRLLKVIHGWGSSGEGGKLGPAIRRSLRLRVKEGKVEGTCGERWTCRRQNMTGRVTLWRSVRRRSRFKNFPET